MVIKRIILIRPGETAWNREGRWQGWVSAPLSEHGKRQARALASYVRHTAMSALYSSDLKRAVETAELLAQALEYPPFFDLRLRERSIGAWQGLTQSEIESWYQDDYHALLADREQYRIPGGESRADVRARALEAFRDILVQDKGETVGILSHTTTIKILLDELIPGYDPTPLELDNTSVTTLRHKDDGTWELVAADDISHLDGLESRSFPELEDSHL